MTPEPYEPRHQKRSTFVPSLADPIVRKWLYGIVTALIPLLVIYGYMTEEAAPLWGALAGQIFATGTAFLNTNADT